MPEMSTRANILEAIVQQNKAGLTSATIHGPVNAPDFDTMKKHSHHPVNGHSRGPSPTHHKVEQKMFIPQQILKRENTDSTLRGPTAETGLSPKASPSTVASQATAFKPQILKRPQQLTESPTTVGSTAHTQGLLGLFKNQASPQSQPTPPAHFPAPAAQASFDRRDTLPSDQKNALLSLFSKPSQPAGSPIQASRSPLAPPSRIPSLPSGSPVPPARSPQPPTPKTLTSGVISPVSPLPDKGSQQNSPANLASRSRISSIGEAVAPSVVIPQHMAPTSHPVMMSSGMVGQKNGVGSGAEGSASPISTGLTELGVSDRARKQSADGKSPVDKTFLLGFLNDVARKGR